jgi:hypothetical protein
MAKKLPLSTPAINRLRAAAALIPIIESGLAESRLSAERAALMASFCEWAVESPIGDPAALRLVESIGTGLRRIKDRLTC